MTQNLNRISAMLPQQRIFLRGIGAKVGNPPLLTTNFIPPKSWKGRYSENFACIEYRDARGCVRMSHYSSSPRELCDPNPDGGKPIPTGEYEYFPRTVLHTRYVIEQYVGGYVTFDRMIGTRIGHLYRTREEATSALTEMHPNWQDPTAYWEDEIPAKWWHRLLFWRRGSTKSFDLERRLQSGDEHSDAMTVKH